MTTFRRVLMHSTAMSRLQHVAVRERLPLQWTFSISIAEPPRYFLREFA